MASGRMHDGVTWALLLPVFLVARWGFHAGWADALLLTAGTWFGGLVLSPDLDTRSRPFYRWGVFRFIWWPYQWLVPHRSALSHGIFWAPWFRLLYLSAVLVLIYTGAFLYLSYAASGTIHPQAAQRHIQGFLARHINDVLVLGVGIWLGSLAHVLLDGLSSLCGRRRWFGRR